MRENVIQITDSRGQSFMMTIWTPSFWTKWKNVYTGGSKKAGDWKAIDLGFIRYTKGDTWYFASHPGATGNDLSIGAPGAIKFSTARDWGIVLYNYDDRFGTNEMGFGTIQQPWCLALDPGKIEWKQATFADMAQRYHLLPSATGHP